MRAFDFFGGVPAMIVSDNLKSAVIKACFHDPAIIRAQQTGLWHRRADGTDLERLEPRREDGYDPEVIRSQAVEFADFDTAWRSEPPRFYRRVKHSKIEPYYKEETYPRLSGRVA